MAITNGYATLAQLKSRLNIESSDTSEDTLLEQQITAASRAIDGWCKTRFYVVSETRTYTAANGRLVRIDPAVTITAVTTDESGDRAYSVTWDAAADYYLEPANAGTNGRPYTAIRVDGVNGAHRFPSYGRGVRVTGSFGSFTTAPADVTEACLLLAARLYKRKDAPLGVLTSMGSEGAGYARVLPDTDEQRLLAPYRRGWVFA